MSGLEDRAVSQAVRRRPVDGRAGSQFWDVSCGFCGA